jgi:hypothetical protein
MLTPALLFVFGLVTAIWPRLVALPSNRSRKGRLTAIDNGEPEKFFEERRTLTEYAPSARFLLLWRIVGAVVAIGSAWILAQHSGLVT